MTDETRETLTIHADCVEDELDGQAKHGIAEARVLVDRTVLAALRDVLTPRTCGTCRHANTEDMLEGWCHCAAPVPTTDVLFSGPDQVEKWAQKQEHGKRFPFCSMAVPLDEGCKGWQAREGEGGKR